MSTTNPFTMMRRNVEYAIEHAVGLTAIGVSLRKWDDSGKQRVDNPVADRERWLRVDTTSIKTDPFYANGKMRSTHTMQVVMVLPAQAGKKLEDIESLYYELENALMPMTRRQNLQYAVPGFAGFSVRGGEVALAESSQPNRDTELGNLAWSTVAEIEVQYERLIPQ